jgi:hypothetical protein
MIEHDEYVRGSRERAAKRITLEQAAERFPVGAKVKFYPVSGEAKFQEAEVRSEPWALGHGQVVLKITGITGGVCVEHLEKSV